MRFDRTKFSNCRTCPLNGQNVVLGEGPEDAEIVIVGEAPGEQEDREGKPFVGASGRELNKALGEVGIFRHKIYITNVIACRPPKNNITSFEATEAIKCCKTGLTAELDRLSSKKVLMPLGNSSLKHFGITEGITKIRGFVEQAKNFIIIPTYHPAYIMRGNWELYPTWIADFDKVRELSSKNYKPPKENFNINPTLAELEAFTNTCIEKDLTLGVDIETTALDEHYGEIFVISFSTDGENVMTVPFLQKGNLEYWNNGDRKKAYDLVRKLLAKCKTMFQNALFDVPYLEYHGFPVKRISDDTMLIHHATFPDLPHTLGFIVSIYGETPYWKGEFLNRKISISNMDNKVLRTYNARDAAVLHQVMPALEKELLSQGSLFAYGISMRLIRPIMEMISNGLPLNRTKLKNWELKLKRDLDKVETELRSLADLPKQFNLKSNPQKGYLFFNVVPKQFIIATENYNGYFEKDSNLRKNTKRFKDLEALYITWKETKPLTIPAKFRVPTTPTGAAQVNEDSLLALRLEINKRLEVIKNLKKKDCSEEAEALRKTLDFLIVYLNYQELAKLISTYTSYPVDSLGRVHAKYLIHGTATGRLSSNKPNAQNIPEAGRVPFEAGENRLIVNADYTNLELRVLAYMADDDVLIKMFDENKNVHDETTKLLFNMDPGNPDWSTYRKVSKTYRFGRNYGGSPYGMYKRIMAALPEVTMSFEEFKVIDQKFYAIHPRYKIWHDDVEKKVLTTKCLSNAFGRKRYFLGTDNAIIRQGLNFPIQSTAADIINRALIDIYNHIQENKLDIMLIGQVHDALMFEINEEDLTKTKEIIKKFMEQKFIINNYTVRFPVEINSGKSWGKEK